MAGKVKYHELSENEKKKYLGDFYSMVASLQDRDEVKNFFKDLLTLSEIVMISRRIQIARMLLENKTHEEIRRTLKVGFNNISQVERWLYNGFGGYKTTVGKYNKKQKQKERDAFEKYGYPAFSKDWVRKKYPLHYLLTNMLNKK